MASSQAARRANWGPPPIVGRGRVHDLWWFEANSAVGVFEASPAAESLSPSAWGRRCQRLGMNSSDLEGLVRLSWSEDVFTMGVGIYDGIEEIQS